MLDRVALDFRSPLCTFEILLNVAKYRSILILFRIAKRSICRYFFFISGRDPLAGLNHWKDINAVAGVFRAYLRELEEPLFPTKYCNDYILVSRKYVL